MSILDKKHILTINLDDSSIEYSNKIKFYNTDKNISNLYVKIKKANNDKVTVDLTETDLTGLTLKLIAIKPKTNQFREITGVLTKELQEYTCAIYKFELSSEFTNQVGIVHAQFNLSDGLENGEDITIDPFTYEIKASKLTGLNAEIISDPDLPILRQLIKEVQKTNYIDDTNISKFSTYSNEKVDSIIKNYKTEVSEQFISIQSEKLDKNGLLSMANMGQDVKEAMTGGSVAVVGENMVLDINIVDKQVNGNKTTFLKEIINYFNKQTYVKGIVSSVDGHIISNDSFATSNFIRIQSGRTYAISNTYDYAFYDENKQFVRGVEHAKAPLSFTHNNSNEKYIIYTMDLSDVETNMMCENELPNTYIDGSYGKSKIEILDNLKEPIIELINSQNTNKFLNKTWNVLGDSITEHNWATTKNYHDFIKEWTGINVNNYGVSGTGYTETTSTPNNRFIQRVSSMDTNVDIVTVFGGINDFYFGTKPIGQFGDKTSNTFYGAVDELILTLINKFPTKTIAVFTPLISTLSLNPNTRGETLNQYVQAIIEVCNYYAIPVLDLNKCSGLNPNIEVIKTNYIPDGTHPNANGHEKIAYKILSFLESL